MNTPRHSLLVLAILSPLTVPSADFTVRLDQPHYEVVAGISFDIEIVMDPPPSSGLFSFGVRLGYDAPAGPDIQTSEVSVPPKLDFNGPLGAGALRDLEAGFLGIKGTVDPALEPREGYEGTVLANLRLVFPEVGDYRLDLDLYRTVGATEQIFVSGTGDPLDANLVFRGATVSVIPEPGTLVLLLSGAALLWVFGRTPEKSRA